MKSAYHAKMNIVLRLFVLLHPENSNKTTLAIFIFLLVPMSLCLLLSVAPPPVGKFWFRRLIEISVSLDLAVIEGIYALLVATETTSGIPLNKYPCEWAGKKKKISGPIFVVRYL